MQLVNKINDWLTSIEEKDLYKYIGAFFAILLLITGLFLWFHHGKVKKYRTLLAKVNTDRVQAKNLITSYKQLMAQKEKAEDILNKHKDFRIGETYQLIIQKTGLVSHLTDKSPPTTGERIAGKTEVLVSSTFTGISMKQLIDLLTEIALVPQLYTKDLTIRKNATEHSIDVDLTVATLETSTVE